MFSNIQKIITLIWLVSLVGITITSCSEEQHVVVYCTVDQVFSEPILQDFEQETGIRVKAIYDTEETKSTGVLNRLIAEKDNPQCDVFWSGDPMRNNVLKSKGITQAYQSTATALIPDYYKGIDHHWTGFSARARVLIYNKKLIAIDELPQSILAFTKPAYRGRFTIANPLFGTTTFHIAALFDQLGIENAKQWMTALHANKVVLATSNGDVKRKVVNGEVAFGLTDTDDAMEAQKESDDVAFNFLGQEQNDFGALIIPNALSVIKGSRNTTATKLLMDYLLSQKTERKLAVSCGQMPLIAGAKLPSHVPSLDHIKPMKINYNTIINKLENIQSWLKQWVDNTNG